MKFLTGKSMRHLVIILTLFIWSEATFASKETVLVCPMKDCKDCQLLLDVKEEKAEYMDNESSHLMAQISKDGNKRIFMTPVSQEIPSPGFRLIFSRKNKIADLIEINFADKSEKYRYKKLNCKFTSLTLSQ